MCRSKPSILNILIHPIYIYPCRFLISRIMWMTLCSWFSNKHPPLTGLMWTSMSFNLTLAQLNQNPYRLVPILIYSLKGTAKAVTREGPLDSLSILYVIDEPKFGLHKYPTISDFLKDSKTFIPRREVRKRSRYGSNWFSYGLLSFVNS